ncbi:MAG: phage integrase N-terminal SAM-like domain-containing protein, partial [Thermodesulfobacteriota bacterium]|nr:phage integrase N-terminal SAM-like domain-containing protein [Thermodesulfobacteriota bacterium]
MENHKSTIKQISSDLKARYRSMIVQKGVPEKYLYYYEKWLRYYLDFCEKYRFNQLNKENLVHFIKKLKDKKQTDQQQKQANHSISLYYEIESNNFGKNKVSKDKSKKISTKKEGLELTNANWVHGYSDLTA